MFGTKNLKKLFEALNDELVKRNHASSFIIMGGGALIAAEMSGRHTTDVDVAFPAIDRELQLAARAVAQGVDAPADWLNAGGAIFARQLPEGWQERSLEIYKGAALTIFRLANVDLIKTKCLAYFDRVSSKDKSDLLALKPSLKELQSAEAWLLEIKEPEEAGADIKNFFRGLRKDLRLK